MSAGREPESPKGAGVAAANAFAALCREAALWLAADRERRDKRARRLSPDRPGGGSA